MLKDQRRLDALIRDDAPACRPDSPAAGCRLVGIHHLRNRRHVDHESGVFDSRPGCLEHDGTDGTWANLTLAYVLGLVAATGVCLPSFYFYGLLAGVKLSMLQSAAHAVKCLAVTAVVLVGGLPIYVAVSLGMIVFSAPDEWLRFTITLGLALPFIAGLWGVRTRCSWGSRISPTRCRRVARQIVRASYAADRRVGCLLHGRHAGDDRLALDASLRLTAGSSWPVCERRFWPWVLPRR